MFPERFKAMARTRIRQKKTRWRHSVGGRRGDKLFKQLQGSHVEKGLRLFGVSPEGTARASKWTPRKPHWKSTGVVTL